MVKKPIDSRRNDRRSADQDDTMGADTKGAKDLTDVDTPRRIDRLAEVVDRCTDAQRLAEALNEKLLAYLLAMAIQEARAGMRVEVAAAAKGVETPLRQSRRARRLPGAG